MSNTDRSILVTGAAGFIGSKVAELLLAEGHTVVGVDNLNDYYDVRLKNHRANTLLGQTENPRTSPTLTENSAGLAKVKSADGQFHFYHLDIENRQSVDALFEAHNFGSVLNLAARAGVWHSMENPYVYMSTNTVGTLNLLEAMRRREVNKMVFASTSSLYAGQEMPFVETQPVNTPISPYAATKKAAELMAHSYHYLYGLDISVVRYFTVFGPCGRPDMSMFRFIEWILNEKPIELFGDGEQSRDFTYVDDIARGTIAAQKEVGYEVINLGGGNNPVSINWLIKQFETALAKRAAVKHLPLHKTNLKSSWADIAKAKRLLDWEPQVSIEDGIRKPSSGIKPTALGWMTSGFRSKIRTPGFLLLTTLRGAFDQAHFLDFWAGGFGDLDFKFADLQFVTFLGKPAKPLSEQAAYSRNSLFKRGFAHQIFNFVERQHA